MAQNLYQTIDVREILLSVRSGMHVSDANEQKVGKVRDVQFANRTGDTPMMAEDFYKLPNDAQNRLMQEGFVQVDAGLFSRDRFILASQIEAVNDEGVQLSVSRD